jgi:pyruvate dehydrogenase E2 component (dihydrolipoamide acetyltransferase)
LQKIAAQAAQAAPAPKPVSAESLDFSRWGKITRRPLSTLRQTISRRMSETWSAVPRVTQFDEADITVLNDWRKKHGPAYEKHDTKLTLTSFALKVVAEGLKLHPGFNASLDEAAQELVLKEYIHIGLAVDTEHGLIVPVIRDADKKSLLELSQNVTQLAEKARTRRVSLEELQGGTFTISNQGGIGGGHFTPIVNKPEVAILGLGRGALKPVVRDGRIEPRLMLPLALSYDHRVIDGGSAARFITALVQGFENFNEDWLKL